MEPIHGISFTAAPSHYWQTFSGFNMAVSLPTFPPFDVHSDASSTVVRWKKWLRRFENMMIGLNMKDDLKRKRALLLHYTGEEINDIFETLPDTGEENNYQAAIDALKHISLLRPIRNSRFTVFVKPNSSQMKPSTRYIQGYNSWRCRVASQTMTKKSRPKSSKRALLTNFTIVPYNTLNGRSRIS